MVDGEGHDRGPLQRRLDGDVAPLLEEAGKEEGVRVPHQGMDLGGRQRPAAPHLHSVREAVQGGIESLRVAADQVQGDRPPPGGEQTDRDDRQGDVLARVGQISAADEQTGGRVAVALGTRPAADRPAGGGLWTAGIPARRSCSVRTRVGATAQSATR